MAAFGAQGLPRLRRVPGEGQHLAPPALEAVPFQAQLLQHQPDVLAVAAAQAVVHALAGALGASKHHRVPAAGAPHHQKPAV